MAGQTGADHAALIEAAKFAAGAGERIDGAWRGLVTNLDTLQGQFVGAAAARFNQKRGEMQQNLMNINRALDQIAEGVGVASNEIAAADAEADAQLAKAPTDLKW